MKNTLLLFLLLINGLAFGQLPNHHLTHIGQLTYNPIVNDIWGYVDSAGTEYALIGNSDGVSIVSLANPAAPVEVAFIIANSSIWRDIKTFGSRAYAVTEGGGGILIIDLSDLPNSVSHHFHTNMVSSAHNLWIDEQGFLFTVGGGFDGQPLYFDLNPDPDTPTYVGVTLPSYYSHDAYVRGDTMWSANINDGFFSVFDVSNKSNPQFLASQETSREFCHNVWLSDDGQTLFTTDEKAGAWIGAYDVSDLSDIKELDQWRTPNNAVVPHNVHVHQDYLVISYYDDGIVVLDGSRPHNLIEVARYDTYPLAPTSLYDGAWGAYPFLPSGRILVSDRQTGLHVLEPNYQRACWLEGVVTDSMSGTPIFGVEINITGPSGIPTEYSTILGDYKTGTHQAGLYQVSFSKLGYISKSISTTLQNGQLTLENIALVSAPTAILTIDVEDNQATLPLENAVVEIRGINVDTTYIGITDQNGLFQKDILYGNYDVWVGKWGHQTQLNSIGISNNSTLPVGLNRGYKDEFELDLGWTKSLSSTTGEWVIQEPFAIPGFVFPFITFDANDLGQKCITTNPYPSVAPVLWQDLGVSFLNSPRMDLSNASDPYLNFQYHFFSFVMMSQNYLEVYVSNATDTVLVASFDSVDNVSAWKNAMPIRILDYIPLSDSMQVHFHSINHNPSNFIRSWVDDFYVVDSMGMHIATKQIEAPKMTYSIAPNPFSNSFQFSFENLAFPANLVVYNSLGQTVEKQIIHQPNGTITLGKNWNKGLYFINLGKINLQVIKN